MREYRDKPSPGVIRILNELAGLSAIHRYAGTPEAEAVAALMAHAERRIGPARPHPDAPPDGGRWIDGRWIRPSAASRDDP